MPASYEAEQLIEAPPGAVFDFLTDQSRLPLWSPQVVRSEVVGGGLVEAGARLRQVRRRGGREVVTELEVTEHRRPHLHVVRARILGTEAQFSFRLEPRSGGTLAHMRGEVEGRGPGRLVAGLLARIMERADRGALARLDRALRSSRTPEVPEE